MAARRLTELTSFQDLHDRVGEEGDLRDFLYDTNLRVGIITQAEFEHYLRLGGNFWQYEGEPRPEQAHALFTNGGHVGHFINLGGALKQNDAFAKLMAHQLLGYAIQPYWQGPIDRVIGSDSSATRLAELVGQATGYSLPGRMVKVEEAGEKRQDWPEDQQPICPGEIVAHVEELVSTASTIWRIKDGVARAHPGVRIGWIPAVFTVVDQRRPKAGRVESGIEVVSLYQYAPVQYTAENCFYCNKGSVALRPREGNNWQYFSGTPHPGA